MYFWNTIMMKTGDDMKYYSRLIGGETFSS